jgi:hypothetical protein
MSGMNGTESITARAEPTLTDTSVYPDHIQITVGGVHYEVRRLPFRALSRVWKSFQTIAVIGNTQFPPDMPVEKAIESPDFMEWQTKKIESMMEVICIGIRDTKVSAESMLDQMTIPESRLVPAWYNELLRISGFTEGQGAPLASAQMTVQAQAPTLIDSGNQTSMPSSLN